MERRDLRHFWNSTSLAQQFAVASLLVIVASMLFVGWWTGREIEARVTQTTGTTTALFTNSFVAPQLQVLANQDTLPRENIDALRELISGTPLGKRIVSIKIWAPGGRIIYSSQPSQRNRIFPESAALRKAWHGEVVSELSELAEKENQAERDLGEPLLETYSPVREAGTGRVIAVAEFYELADQLQTQLTRARDGAWLVVAAATVAIFLMLFSIVRRGSRTIELQQSELRSRIEELSNAAQRNDELHTKVRQASRQATELNERFLRRISGDLHDGPAQYIGYALLRFDALRTNTGELTEENTNRTSEFNRVRDSLNDALREIRQICSGMALPELDGMPLSKVLSKAVRAHERKTETTVQLVLENLSADAPLTLKICLYRLIQEALNNAYLHSGGVGQSVRVHMNDEEIDICISDNGKGFAYVVEQSVSDRLGVVGMRRRVEEIGGDFNLQSSPGAGTHISARIPLGTMEQPVV